MEEKKPKKKYIIELSREEVENEIRDIQENPKFKFALDNIDGQRLLDKHNKLIVLLESEEKEEKKAEK